jgi:protein-tyrosine phosphatase
VDDGAPSIEVAMEMLRVAVDDGVDEMILTPHYYKDKYENEAVPKMFAELSEEILIKGLGIKLHLGNEIYLNEQSVQDLETGGALTLSGSDYLLIELPFYQIYPFHEKLLLDLQLKGYKIVIAHIERYDFLHGKTNLLASFVQRGMYGQLTAKFLNSRKTSRKGLKWIKEGKVHLIASDAHDLSKRPPLLSESYKYIEKKLGSDCAKLLFENNPRKIIENSAKLNSYKDINENNYMD